MSDHVLVVVALLTGILNAVASLVRTIWQYEKRRAWKARQYDEQ